MGKYLYVCPSCKHANEQHISYCVNCGQWMHSTIHPPKTIKKFSPGEKLIKTIGIIAGVFIVLFVAFQIFKTVDLSGVSGGGSLQALSTKIDLIESEQFKITQFVISQSLTGKVDATLDFTLLQDNPSYVGQMELKTVFYSSSGDRVAMANALLPQKMAEGQTTTVKLKFENNPDIMKMNEVRVELAFPTVLDTIEKLNESIGDIK